jgi:hypothetical protein
MAGLLDQYLLAGNAQAFAVVTGMAAWVKARTERLSTSAMPNALRTEFAASPSRLPRRAPAVGTRSAR